MKKLYEKPAVELVVFNYADVMAASGDPVSTWLIDDDDSPVETISETANWIPPETSVDSAGAPDIGSLNFEVGDD